LKVRLLQYEIAVLISSPTVKRGPTIILTLALPMTNRLNSGSCGTWVTDVDVPVDVRWTW